MTVLGLSTAMVFSQAPRPGGPGRGGGPGPGPGGGGPRGPDAGDAAAMTAAAEGTRVGIGLAADLLRGALARKPAPARVAVVAAEPGPVMVSPAVTTVESKLIWVLDRNHDGIIDEEEILLAPVSLKKLDLNKDGQLSRGEYLSPAVQLVATAPVPPLVVAVAPPPPGFVEPGPVVGPHDGPGPVAGPHGSGPAPGGHPGAPRPGPQHGGPAPHHSGPRP